MLPCKIYTSSISTSALRISCFCSYITKALGSPSEGSANSFGRQMPRASHGFQYNAISIKSVSTEAFRCPCNTHFRREKSWQSVSAQLPASTVCHHPPANTLRQLPSASTLRQPPSASTLRQLPHANTLRQLWARFRIRKQRNNR